MEASQFAAMLSNKKMMDLKKMQYKYSPSDVSEFVEVLKNNLFNYLPIRDFNGNPIAYLENVSHLRMSAVKILLSGQSSISGYSLKAMEDEIYSSLSIENIESSRASIRRILEGCAPKNESEDRLFGIKKGLDFISDSANKITEENIYMLYQLSIGDYLNGEAKLLDGKYYRHDAVYIMGTQLEHQGLSHHILSEYMGQLIEFIETENKMNDLVKAAVIHFYMGYIHPYFDGNGRMARLIHLWYLVQQGYSATLFIPFSNYINRTRKKYYNAYTLTEENARISGVLDLTPFLVYFVEEIYNRLKPSVISKSASMKLYDDALTKGIITEKEKKLYNFVLAAYGNDEFSTKELEKDYGDAAYATIRSFVLKFYDLGLLDVRKYGNRNKYFII